MKEVVYTLFTLMTKVAPISNSKSLLWNWSHVTKFPQIAFQVKNQIFSCTQVIYTIAQGKDSIVLGLKTKYIDFTEETPSLLSSHCNLSSTSSTLWLTNCVASLFWILYHARPGDTLIALPNSTNMQSSFVLVALFFFFSFFPSSNWFETILKVLVPEEFLLGSWRNFFVLLSWPVSGSFIFTVLESTCAVIMHVLLYLMVLPLYNQHLNKTSHASWFYFLVNLKCLLQLGGLARAGSLLVTKMVTRLQNHCLKPWVYMS